MSSSKPSVTLCGQELAGIRHVCAFYDSRDEEYAFLNPYLREGLEQGEKVVTIVESAFHGEHLARMRAGGVPVAGAVQKGQLDLLASESTYTQDGMFVRERMYSLIEQTLSEAERDGFSRVRTCGDMEWALQNLPSNDELMSYEAHLNLLAPKHDCTLLCVYDVNRFSGRVVADVLATHSHVILNGRVHENPYYVDPFTFLQKLSLRRQPVPLARA